MSIESCNATAFVSRDRWNAEPVEHEVAPPAKVVYFKVADIGICTEERSCGRYMKSLQRNAMSNNQTDIEYNFVVGYAGNVYEGRGFNHTAGLNRDEDESQTGIVIGVFGSRYNGELPPPRTMAAIMNLFVCGMDNGSVVKDVKIRHIEETGKPCTGSLGERLQRMITAAYGSGNVYNPVFECISN